MNEHKYQRNNCRHTHGAIDEVMDEVDSGYLRHQIVYLKYQLEKLGNVIKANQREIDELREERDPYSYWIGKTMKNTYLPCEVRNLAGHYRYFKGGLAVGDHTKFKPREDGVDPWAVALFNAGENEYLPAKVRTLAQSE